MGGTGYGTIYGVDPTHTTQHPECQDSSAALEASGLVRRLWAGYAKKQRTEGMARHLHENEPPEMSHFRELVRMFLSVAQVCAIFSAVIF